MNHSLSKGRQALVRVRQLRISSRTALAQQKTVLFMAEKLAALNVVKDRLNRDAKLGEYCLELHSRQASVKAIHDQVKKRLAITVRPAEPTQRNVALYWVKRNRDILNESWDALTGPMRTKPHILADDLERGMGARRIGRSRRPRSFGCRASGVRA